MRPCVVTLLIHVLAISHIFADDSLFDKRVKPLSEKLCISCHSTKKHKGDLDLEKHLSLDGIKKHPEIWEKVLEQIDTEEMPPKKKKNQFTPEEKKFYTGWIRQKLDSLALERAGDPGPVVLRRLSNAEYTYTVRDLTGIKGLDPAREFPVDGAAGEGFTNTGMSLVMSPALVTKFLNAGKEISNHAILVPDGIRWSNGTSRRDCTNEILEEIRDFYSKFTVPGERHTVTLQGIVLDSSNGRKLPHGKYLHAAYKVKNGANLKQVAAEMKLSEKYLTSISDFLNGNQSDPVAGGIRHHWKNIKENEVNQLKDLITKWQNVLWKFNKVGEVGLPDKPPYWMTENSPVTDLHKLNLKLPKDTKEDQLITITVSDNKDGSGQGTVRLKEPVFIMPGGQRILLKDTKARFEGIQEYRQKLLSVTVNALEAAAEIQKGGQVNIDELAKKHGIDKALLKAWLKYLGIEADATTGLAYLTEKLEDGRHAFIKGWGSAQTPSMVTNSSDKHVRIPGNAKPHGVMMHPSPELNICAGWRSPINGKIKVSGQITHAHPECGNGVTWQVQLRRGTFRQQIAAGVAHGQNIGKFAPQEFIAVREGDLVSVIIGPRDGNHSCDLTDVEFKITPEGSNDVKWSLTKDVSSNPLAGNPHADSAGVQNIWHFYTEKIKGNNNTVVIPQGSLLAKWLGTENAQEKSQLAKQLQSLITGKAPAAGADLELYKQLTSLKGELLRGIDLNSATNSSKMNSKWGVDSSLFKGNDIVVKAGSKIEINIPGDLAPESIVEANADLISGDGESSVRLKIVRGKQEPDSGNWWSGDTYSPILAKKSGAVRQNLDKAIGEIRELFPAAVCYNRIVPVDDVVTLKIFFREDHHLARLALNKEQDDRLNKIWHELNYVSHHPLIQVDAFEQIWQYVTQGGDPSFLKPLKKPLYEAADNFKKELVETQPAHVKAVLEFAEKAYRRPLKDSEKEKMQSLYTKLISQNVPHEDAVKLLLTRVLISTGFLYKEEIPGKGKAPGPVSSFELATRLSYFLWSSQPDEELLNLAANGEISKPEVLRAQVNRMLKDPRTRRMATEFGCSWLHIHGFNNQSEKSEKHFPTFNGMKGEMYEEAIQFFSDFFQNDRSVLELLSADHTFVNDKLAGHYGIPGVQGNHWRRLDGAKRFSRGGILGLGATLAQHSGASRTSPILRGNWITEVVLGQKPPKPPKDVPQLPEDESVKNLTMREITEKHTKDPRCSKCHSRIDPFGFALENFDAIGRYREKDHLNRPFNVDTKVPDGTELKGFEGLRKYLLTTKRDAFISQFSKKLLGYSLGRGVILSDKPLLDDIKAKLAANEFKVSVVVESIVLSKQFREIRGREAAFENLEEEE